MKNTIKIIVALSAFAGLYSCEQSKKSTITESGTEVVQIRTPEQDTANADIKPQAETRSVEGKVVSINRGKDGYTAELKTAEGETYHVTISRSNLDNHDQYISVKMGDNLNVSGDYWKMDQKDQITVRIIK